MTREATSRRVARPSAALLVVVAVVACSGDTAYYGPPHDDIAMAAIASEWTEAGGLSLSLCEDVARSAAWTGPSCQVDHVVRGGGLGMVHSGKEQTTGCGGCQYRVVAYVQGTATGASLTGAVAVTGIVYLRSYRVHDPYAFPYYLDASCSDQGAPCRITGTLTEDGRLAATVTIGSPAGSPTQHSLTRVGAAACP